MGFSGRRADELASAMHLDWSGPFGRDGMKLVGILLIVSGIVALLVGGIRYTKREKVIDLGPIQATTEKHEQISLPPTVGIVSVAAGVVLVVADSRTRA